MNKNLKRIIAIVLAIGTVSAVAPTTNINFLTTKAYASDTNDDTTLESLELYDADDNTIRIYEDNDYKDRVNEDEVQEDETYYAKTSSNTISIDTSGPKSKFVKIFNGTSDSKKGKDVNDDIQLSDDSTVTTIIVKVYGEDTEDDTVRNNEDDDNKYDLQNTYEIKVKHLTTDNTDSTSDTDNASNYDKIYLARLSIGGKMIELSDSQIKYAYNVDSDVDKVEIRATPEDEGDDDVTIDGKDANPDDKYKTTVDLNKGENVIEIEVEDDGKSRVYTLIINRGKTTSTSTSTTTTESNATDVANTHTNQWVQVNGKWKYNDSTGKPVRNTWVQNYYLQDNGDMATGWLNYSGSWYYLGTDGAKKTGWKSIDGTWYYLDSQGKIHTGWFKDIDGKYYYLNSYGGMAYNTTIDGYKLGANGAWTGK